MIYWVDRARDGFENMAIDESMARIAAEFGSPMLRIYQWAGAFLTLGYFQSANDIQTSNGLQQLPFARRLSGGGAIVHDHELTYCIAVPDNTGSKTAAGDLYCLVHNAIASFFAERGCNLSSANCQVTRHNDEPTSFSPFLCFERRSSADLLLGSHKIVGSAQRRLGGAILQHGSILLARSSYAHHLPGILDLVEPSLIPNFQRAERLSIPLAEHIAKRFTEEFSDSTAPTSSADQATIHKIEALANCAEARFKSTEWNCRR